MSEQLDSEEQVAADESSRPAGELEYRAAEQIGVSFPKRTIELIVMPYEQETLVPWKGRVVREVVAPGAFDGVERRPNRIRVNRDHEIQRTVGRALALHPSRDEGLVAELRIAQTELGDETLALADEGILDASAAFLPMPDGESWPERNLRRLTKLWLGHIAMTPDPAYAGANVLAVRRHERPVDEQLPPPGRAATPNLDAVRAMMLEDRYGSIRAR